MSRNSQSIDRLVREVTLMFPDERIRVHGIQIDESGSVKDLIESKTYKNIRDWAVAYTSEEEVGGFEMISKNGPGRFEEDY